MCHETPYHSIQQQLKEGIGVRVHISERKKNQNKYFTCFKKLFFRIR